MFFNMIIKGDKADLVSWIISKNPKNDFERDIKRGKILASFDRYSPNIVGYSGYLENYDLPFLKICREENLESYVNSEQYSVNPYNLELLDTVFRSVLRGRFQDIAWDSFQRKYSLEFKIGPFSLYNMKYIIQALQNCGFLVYLMDKDNNIVEDQEKITEATYLTIEGVSDITSFLQKIYVICYAYTAHLRSLIPLKQEVTKYALLASSWINSHPDKNYIRNKISKVIRNSRQFEEVIIWSEDTEKTSEDIRKEVNNELKSRKRKASELRYSSIISLISEDNKVLDFGCGGGNLIHRLLKVKKPKKLIGFDCNKKSISTAKVRGKHQIRNSKNNDTEFNCFCGSILYPDFSLFEDIDTVVLSEVAEHFEIKEFNRVSDIVFKGINPDRVILTTPNKDYNSKFNMPEGTLRHPDHKFEWDKLNANTYARYIAETYGYTYYFMGVIYSTSENGVEDEDNVVIWRSVDATETISHIIVFEKSKDNKDRGQKIRNEMENLFTPFTLDASAYRISERIIREGSSLFSHKIDPRWIVALTPNMSPADSSEVEGYLEHPYEALDYYISRGVKELIAETKYMGSNATIIAIKDVETSRKIFGSEDCIKIYSRKGYPFFDNKETELRIYDKIKSFMDFLGKDVIALEGKILPWSLKAGVMIDKDFNKPGLCALMDKKMSGRSYVNEELFLQSLSNYTALSDLEIYPYKIIFSANFDGKRFKDISNGNYIFHENQIEVLDRLGMNNNLFRRVDYRYFNIETSSKEEIVEYWNNLERWGYEGIVIKPRYPTCFLSNGRYIQPALKCRTRNYLRLIYGINYLEPENLRFLKKRGAAHKRKLAMQQFELSQKILYSFLNRNTEQQLKYVFSFFGMEGVSNIDKTL